MGNTLLHWTGNAAYNIVSQAWLKPWKYNKSDLIYDVNYSFNKYCNIKKFANLSLKSKYSFLANFFNDLNKFNSLKVQKEKQKKKKTNEYDTASKLYNVLLKTYFDEYYNLSDAKRSKMDPRYDPANLTLDEHEYSELYKKRQMIQHKKVMTKN